ncbi:regulator of sigma D [Methylomagnum ishizawai]|uniref:Regulator of sigma D n=1 Tax=Methylomagnum ishizawai TaxID=1760988 RepID=A0A1Y6CUL3_9GAMM|nr:Rsd/AlgQ family anti-sigma factor [Methylomagnum ishizawai]SMF93997.1 regulator of sigma D [Methylomagnum ishizawai]
MNQTLQERRHNTGQLIQELLEERQQLWSQYCALSGMQPFASGEPLDIKIQEFCGLLVDYISLGHFGIYQRLTDGSERRGRILRVAEKIYPRIIQATGTAVDFNDKYEKLSGDALREHLAEDLSKLGEELVLRNDLEDQLLAAMTS